MRSHSRRGRRLAAPLLILLVLGALWPRTRVPPVSSYDQRFYLGIAYDLLHLHRFTDGFAYAGGGPDSPRPAGMRFTPLYPALLAAAALADPRLARSMACTVATAGRDPGCPRDAPLIRLLQVLMLAGFYWLVWLGIEASSGSTGAAWAGLLLALLTAPGLLGFAATLMTEILSLLLSAGACCLAARTLARDPRRAGGWFACALLLGLATLTRPVFLVLVWGGLGVAILALVRWRRAALAPAAAFAGGSALTLLPWILRNALVLNRAALSFGYASHTLIQRLAFDTMTRREYALSFVCWLPDGSGLGRLLAGRGACDRFGWDEHADSFYAIGTGPLLRQSLAASGGWAHHMSYIVHHYLLAHPLRYLAVSLPLALRGLYVDHYWGLLLAPCSLVLLLGALRQRRWRVVALSLPAWLLLLVNAFVAVNQPRYNMLLILPFSLAGGLLLAPVPRHLGRLLQKHVA